MTTLIFATHNLNKAAEIERLLPDNLSLQTLNDISLTEEIPETGKLLEENALLKAEYVFRKTGNSCFADDTGLEVEALNGAPGVYSARYAGEEKSSEANMEKLLKELEDKENRRARFRTVIAYIDEKGDSKLFEGMVEGNISLVKNGAQGFGYDPIFIPEDSSLSFAQMSADEKNSMSHRARALAKFLHFLQSQKS